MQPTAQAVGRKRETTSPRGAEELKQRSPKVFSGSSLKESSLEQAVKGRKEKITHENLTAADIISSS